MIRRRLGIFLCTVALILSALPLLASDERIFLGKKDGIELHVARAGGGPSDKDPASCLSFTATNTNDYDLIYLNNARGRMFSFKLLDSSGKVISQIPNWYRWNDPYSSDVGMRARTPIPPGEHIEFTICLKEAYGDRWKEGKTLLVQWEPSDGNNGRIYIGWKMEAKCDLTDLSKSVEIVSEIEEPKRYVVPGVFNNEDQSPRFHPVPKPEVAPETSSGEDAPAVNSPHPSPKTITWQQIFGGIGLLIALVIWIAHRYFKKS